MNPQAIAQLLAQAVAHHQAGRVAAARPLYAQIQRAAPGNFDAWHLGGLAALQAGEHGVADAQLARAIQLKPDSALALMRLGVVRAALGRLDDAAGLLQRAAVRDPKAAEPWEHLAAVERRRGRLDDAIQAARAVCALRRDSPEAFFRVCHLVIARHGMGGALPVLEEATRLWPENAEAWKNLGTALANLHRAGPALKALDRACRLCPGLPGLDLGLGLAFQQAGRLEDAIQAYGRVLAADPSHAEAGSARLLCLNYSDTSVASIVAEAARAYGAARPRRGPAWRAPAFWDGARPLRVAVVSPDLRRHAVAQFFLPLLAHLPPGELEVWLYHDHPAEDAVSAELKKHAARWTNLAGLPHDAVRDRLRADAPDLLLDLAGHTGFNRLPVYAERVAPVQVSYLGYPGTTGLVEMDFRLTDALADPEGTTEAWHTEKLVRFPSCAWAFSPAPDSGVVVAPRGGAGEPVVFGSFNTPAKLSNATLRLWARVLDATPGSRLLLKGHGFDEPETAAEWRGRLAACGIDPDHVELVGRISSTGGHLALYARVDVALDPFPYHGTTTTCEALWMGRPVVTLAGVEHRSRVGVSLLSAAGHPEWIADNADSYVKIASALARDLDGRRALAASLRDQLSRGPLLDYPGQARAFASALRSCTADIAKTLARG